MHVSAMTRYIVVLVSALILCQSPASSSWEDEEPSLTEGWHVPVRIKGESHKQKQRKLRLENEKEAAHNKQQNLIIIDAIKDPATTSPLYKVAIKNLKRSAFLEFMSQDDLRSYMDVLEYLPLHDLCEFISLTRQHTNADSLNSSLMAFRTMIDLAPAHEKGAAALSMLDLSIAFKKLPSNWPELYIHTNGYGRAMEYSIFSFVCKHRQPRGLLINDKSWEGFFFDLRTMTSAIYCGAPNTPDYNHARLGYWARIFYEQNGTSRVRKMLTSGFGGALQLCADLTLSVDRFHDILKFHNILKNTIGRDLPDHEYLQRIEFCKIFFSRGNEHVLSMFFKSPPTRLIHMGFRESSTSSDNRDLLFRHMQFFYRDGGRNCNPEHLYMMLEQIAEPHREKAIPSLLIADASFNSAWKQSNEWYRDLSALSEFPEENQPGVLQAYLEVYVPDSIQDDPYTYRVDCNSTSQKNAEELKIINRFLSCQRFMGASIYASLQSSVGKEWGFNRLIKKLPQDRILSILETCYRDLFYNSKPATAFLATVFLPEPTKTAFIKHHSERGAHFLDVVGWFKYDAIQDQEAMINHWRQELNMRDTNKSEDLYWLDLDVLTNALNFQEPNGAIAYLISTIAYNGALAEDHELVVKVRALKRERLMQKLSSTVRKIAEKTSREILMSPQKYGIKYQATDKLYQKALRVAHEFSKA